MQRKGTCRCSKDNKKTEANLTFQKHESRKFNICTGLDARKLINTPRSSQIKVENSYDVAGVVDTINTGESLTKLLIFEPISFSNDTEKCVSFWKYLKEQNDIKPKRLVRRTKDEKEIEGEDDAVAVDVHENVTKDSNIDWEDILRDIQRLQLHKAAMVAKGADCEFCKEVSHGDYVRYTLEDEINDEIVALNSWKPVKLTDANTQTSAIKLVDKATDNQSTESFKIMYEENKPKEYVDKATDVQNVESLINTKWKRSVCEDKLECLRKINICTCSQLSIVEVEKAVTKDEIDTTRATCPYHKLNCTCGDPTMMECPYHKISCTCGDPTKTECPYHKINCTCGDPTKMECPYHKISCTCGDFSKIECPYHKIRCTCGKFLESDCPYHKVCCKCLEQTEISDREKSDILKELVGNECPYQKPNCTCKESIEKEYPYNKIQIGTDPKRGISSNREDSAGIAPYHKKGRNSLGENLPDKDVHQESIKCPYHKETCNCENFNIKVSNVQSCDCVEELIIKPISSIIDSTSSSCACSIDDDNRNDTLEDLINCPYEIDECDCSFPLQGEDVTLCPYEGSECNCDTILDCPYGINVCKCASKDDDTEVKCPEIILECTCGKRVQKCACFNDRLEKTPCPYENLNCTCGNDCPYNISNCDCANADICQCNYPKLKCPNNSKECNCIIENIPCPYGKEDCVCGIEHNTAPLDIKPLCKNSACST